MNKEKHNIIAYILIINFNYTYSDYAFLFVTGNNLIHLISSNGRHKLRVNLEVMTGGKYFSEYSTFRLEDESNNYLLHVTDYNGTAGENFKFQKAAVFLNSF